MGKIITQKRKLNDGINGIRYNAISGAINVVLTNYVAPTSQETTSFRSGSAELVDLRNEALVTRNGFKTYPPKFDNGHEFSTTKSGHKVSHRNMRFFKGNKQSTNSWLYHGPVNVHLDNSTLASPFMSSPVIGAMSQNDINFYGGKAIAATRPLKEQVSLSQLAGEIFTGGLPSLSILQLENLKKGLKPEDIPKRGSEEFLNYQFGWVPLVNDVIKLCKSVVNANATIRQIHRDNGKVVRRSFSFPPEVTTVNDLVLPGHLGGGDIVPRSDRSFWTGVNGANTRVSVVKTVNKSTWFRGAYSYYLPVDDSLMAQLERAEVQANVILGLKLTPAVLWELAPWSWLLDWFANIGDLLSNNVAQSEGLVIRYGYLMRRTFAQNVLTQLDPVSIQGTAYNSLTSTYFTEKKERFRATPYGFGLNTATFNVKQWAILAALGMTKNDKVLRVVS